MATLIASLPGDGIGPEVCREGIRVLDAVASAGGHRFEIREAAVGGAAIDASGSPFPDDTKALCLEARAVLLGAVGGPRWTGPDVPVRPEQGLLDLRAAMNVYANLRPVVTHPALYDASPLRAELLENVDILFVRELTGGIYFGKKSRSADEASDECRYTRGEIRRVVGMAAELATTRRGRLTSIDKANVLDTSRLWREVAEEVAAASNGVELEHLYVDAAAMHLLSRPASFDVMVTENMFGDILSDEASMLAGSLGMLPSASLNEHGAGLYEPIHGSAPDIAGQGIANPCGMILTVAMMLRHSLGLDDEADAVERAVYKALADGYRTADVAIDGKRPCSTTEFGDAVLKALG